MASSSKTVDVNLDSDINVRSTQQNDVILSFLKKIDSRLENVEQKLNKLDVLDLKVDKFEKELKSLWCMVQDNAKDACNKISNMEDRVDHIEVSETETVSKIQQLERENASLKDSLLYVQSQSMRNNLVFGGISESANEKPTETEASLRAFMVNNLKLAQDIVDNIKIERAHRMGTQREGERHVGRNIVCKFTFFKDRELVRNKRSELKGTRFYVHEQFPPDVMAKRRRLVPLMKKAKEDGKTAWISYDTLYINGKPAEV
jgi:DNA repair exonuclease SbcCD ATPase subunit